MARVMIEGTTRRNAHNTTQIREGKPEKKKPCVYRYRNKKRCYRCKLRKERCTILPVHTCEDYLSTEKYTLIDDKAIPNALIKKYDKITNEYADKILEIATDLSLQEKAGYFDFILRAFGAKIQKKINQRRKELK